MKNHNKKSTTIQFYTKIILFMLAGAIMIGHGARMMYQGLFHPQSYYPAPTPLGIDFYFDWLTLAALGIFILSYSLKTFYQHQRKTQQNYIPYSIT